MGGQQFGGGAADAVIGARDHGNAAGDARKGEYLNRRVSIDVGQRVPPRSSERWTRRGSRMLPTGAPLSGGLRSAAVSTDLHWATLWEATADALPDEEAIVQGDRRISWQMMDERASRLAG